MYARFCSNDDGGHDEGRGYEYMCTIQQDCQFPKNLFDPVGPRIKATMVWPGNANLFCGLLVISRFNLMQARSSQLTGQIIIGKCRDVVGLLLLVGDISILQRCESVKVFVQIRLMQTSSVS